MSVPRSTRDGEPVCKISGGAGHNNFVNDAAGFKDGGACKRRLDML